MTDKATFEDIYLKRADFPDLYADLEKKAQLDPVLEESRIKLESVVAEATSRFVSFGFHKEVYPDLSEAEAETRYREDFALPEDLYYPEAYKDRFPYAYVVDPRVRLTRQHALARPQPISEHFPSDKFRDITEHPTDHPYIAFTHDGTRYKPVTVAQAEKLFGPDEVGETSTEVASVYFQYPEFFKGGGRNAAGSRAQYGGVPEVVAYNGKPQELAWSADEQQQKWGVGTRGREIIILGPQKLAPTAA